ncbi:sigma-70 family RNA polymerase sigma factor [Kineococcus sp. SYSU DK006]|uniref:sigma-70 family RNA polymerase sigma factor n=1 Tax=Kineococcus sp. SYSU DK006 TaxID=3383127 RepID=UPI003D7EE119
MSTTTQHDELFTLHRAVVFAVAYEVLGTRADADDVTQDTYLRWRGVDLQQVRDPRAYLATIAARTALNAVRRTARRREDYPGPWLPEPLVVDEGPEQEFLRREQLSYAVTVLLQEARPEQRVVFMLHDVLELPYPAVAEALGKTQAAVRQIAHRTRTRLASARPAAGAAAEHEAVLSAFLAAVAGGDLQALLSLLAPDTVLVSDGGGKVVAARKPVLGADRVAAFLLAITATADPGTSAQVVGLNGGSGVLVHVGARVDLSLALGVDRRGRVDGVYLVRNPDKLATASSRQAPCSSGAGGRAVADRP